MAQLFINTRQDYVFGAAPNPELFRSMEPVESRWNAWIASATVHGVVLILLLAIPFIFTETLKVKYDVAFLAPPEERKPILEVTFWKQPPPVRAVHKPDPLVEPPRKPLLIQPERPRHEEVKPEKVELPKVIEKPAIAPVAANPPRVSLPGPEQPVAGPPKPPVRTDVFSTGSSAQPTTNLPARDVQTGGFGDPNGVRGPGRPDKTANIAMLGSFDLPVGPGAGNGTGGARGTRGTVASAGFGSGVATAGKGGAGGSASGIGGSGKDIRQGGFSDATASVPAPAPKKRDLGPLQTPVEITFKPRPDYTQEARDRKVEGEVLLRVLFSAAGDVRVLDVIRGLGHGLDQNAIRAAQQIRFKPAQRDGQPVDSTATVHIVFQLAY